jgi:drug/metabolite transporter (DMT)-like permease
MATFAKLAGDGLPFVAVVFGRSVVVAAVGLAVVCARGAPLVPTNKRLVLWRSASGFGAMAAYFYALTRVPLANAVTLQYTSPLFVALLSGVTVRERPPPRLFALAAVAFAGVWLIVSPDVRGFDAGALFALASAVLSAFAYLAVRGLRATDGTETIVLSFGLFSLVVSAPGLLMLDRWPTGPELGALLAVGGFAAAGQLAVTHALRLANAAFVTAFSYVAVVVSAGYGVAVFGEVPTLRAAVGSALVIASGIALSALERRT